uniref:Uncharacterized protein n=1 Tax=Triticum urartu TaxID=4572 RepID=A0A8R7PEJ4_TRIUA
GDGGGEQSRRSSFARTPARRSCSRLDAVLFGLACERGADGAREHAGLEDGGSERPAVGPPTAELARASHLPRCETFFFSFLTVPTGTESYPILTRGREGSGGARRASTERFSWEHLAGQDNKHSSPVSLPQKAELRLLGHLLERRLEKWRPPFSRPYCRQFHVPSPSSSEPHQNPSALTIRFSAASPPQLLPHQPLLLTTPSSPWPPRVSLRAGTSSCLALRPAVMTLLLPWLEAMGRSLAKRLLPKFACEMGRCRS